MLPRMILVDDDPSSDAIMPGRVICKLQRRAAEKSQAIFSIIFDDKDRTGRKWSLSRCPTEQLDRPRLNGFAVTSTSSQSPSPWNQRNGGKILRPGHHSSRLAVEILVQHGFTSELCKEFGYVCRLHYSPMEMAGNGAHKKSRSRAERLAEKVFRYAVVLETPECGFGQRLRDMEVACGQRIRELAGKSRGQHRGPVVYVWRDVLFRR